MERIYRFLFHLRSVWAIIAALAVGSILIAAAGSNPIDAYITCFRGRFSIIGGLPRRWSRCARCCLRDWPSYCP